MPVATGSPPLTKTIGMVVVTPLAMLGEQTTGDDELDIAADEAFRQIRQSLGAIPPPAILDRQIYPVVAARFAEPGPECGDDKAYRSLGTRR
jgi:hypothetical protein